jgi:hypothetical protein
MTGHDGRMRRVVMLVTAWLAAAAVAIAVAWQGVGIVTRNVTDDRTPALAASEVRQLAEERDTDARTTTTSATSPTVGPSVTSLPSATTTTTRPGTVASTTPANAPLTTTTTAAPATAETRTYNVVGGSTALRFAPEGVMVLWATPNDGFDVDVEPENANGVRVEFESDSHRSRVEGWWDGGPQERVREDPR